MGARLLNLTQAGECICKGCNKPILSSLVYLDPEGPYHEKCLDEKQAKKRNTYE